MIVETEFLSLVGNYGFPILVTMWFMFRTEKIIIRNTEAIDKLSGMVEQLCVKKK